MFLIKRNILHDKDSIKICKHFLQLSTKYSFELVYLKISFRKNGKYRMSTHFCPLDVWNTWKNYYCYFIACVIVTSTIMLYHQKMVENFASEKWHCKCLMLVLCFEISMSFAAGAFSSGVRGGGGGGDGGARRLFSRIKGNQLKWIIEMK